MWFVVCCSYLSDYVTFCPFQLHKAKSNKELWAFLFNDFLLLTYAVKQFTSSGPDKLFSNKNNVQLKMYKPVRETRKIIIIHCLCVFMHDSHLLFPPACAAERSPGETSGSLQRGTHLPHLTHRQSLLSQDRQHQWTVATHTHALRHKKVTHSVFTNAVCIFVVSTAWIQKIKVASENFIETDNKKREKVYQGLFLKTLFCRTMCWFCVILYQFVLVCRALFEG